MKFCTGQSKDVQLYLKVNYVCNARIYSVDRLHDRYKHLCTSSFANSLCQSHTQKAQDGHKKLRFLKQRSKFYDGKANSFQHSNLSTNAGTIKAKNMTKWTLDWPSKTGCYI